MIFLKSILFQGLLAYSSLYFSFGLFFPIWSLLSQTPFVCLLPLETADVLLNGKKKKEMQVPFQHQIAGASVRAGFGLFPRWRLYHLWCFWSLVTQDLMTSWGCVWQKNESSEVDTQSSEVDTQNLALCFTWKYSHWVICIEYTWEYRL